MPSNSVLGRSATRTTLPISPSAPCWESDRATLFGELADCWIDHAFDLPIAKLVPLATHHAEDPIQVGDISMRAYNDAGVKYPHVAGCSAPIATRIGIDPKSGPPVGTRAASRDTRESVRLRRTCPALIGGDVTPGQTRRRIPANRDHVRTAKWPRTAKCPLLAIRLRTANLPWSWRQWACCWRGAGTGAQGSATCARSCQWPCRRMRQTRSTTRSQIERLDLQPLIRPYLPRFDISSASSKLLDGMDERQLAIVRDPNPCLDPPTDP